MTKVPSELDHRLDLVCFLSAVSWRAVEVSLTSSAEKVRKHVKRISMASLATFVGLEAFLCGVVNTCVKTTASFNALLHDGRILVVSGSMSTDCA